MSGNQVGRRTPDGGKSKNNMSTPQWGGHNYSENTRYQSLFEKKLKLQILTYAKYVVNRLKLWFIYFQNVKKYVTYGTM